MADVTTAGEWLIQPGEIVTPDGVTRVTVISDGRNELATTARPQDLLVALMAYLGVESVSAVD